VEGIQSPKTSHPYSRQIKARDNKKTPKALRGLSNVLIN